MWFAVVCLYRDMKSANVLVKNKNGECAIADLGFAMILDPTLDSKQLASAGQVRRSMQQSIPGHSLLQRRVRHFGRAVLRNRHLSLANQITLFGSKFY